jgi:hypothetical protein
VIERQITNEERSIALRYFEELETGYSYWDDVPGSFGCWGTLGGILSLPVAAIVFFLAGPMRLAYFTVVVICGVIVVGIAGIVNELKTTQGANLYRAQKAREGRQDAENGTVFEYSGKVEKAWYDEKHEKSIDVCIRFIGGEEVVVGSGDVFRLRLTELPVDWAKIVMLPKTRIILSAETIG